MSDTPPSSFGVIMFATGTIITTFGVGFGLAWLFGRSSRPKPETNSDVWLLHDNGLYIDHLTRLKSQTIKRTCECAVELCEIDVAKKIVKVIDAEITLCTTTFAGIPKLQNNRIDQLMSSKLCIFNRLVHAEKEYEVVVASDSIDLVNDAIKRIHNLFYSPPEQQSPSPPPPYTSPTSSSI